MVEKQTSTEELADVVIIAIEKQEPMKPVIQNVFPKISDEKRAELKITWQNYVCLRCGGLTGVTTLKTKTSQLRKKPNYCVDCGQKLDWEERE